MKHARMGYRPNSGSSTSSITPSRKSPAVDSKPQKVGQIQSSKFCGPEKASYFGREISATPPSVATTNELSPFSQSGYGRPPKATQFKPGKSGNPKGRPKGSRNVAVALSEVFTDNIVMREGDKTRRISRLEALLRKQMELALKGDQRAAEAAVRTAREFGLLNQPVPRKRELNLKLLTDEELLQLEVIMKKASGIEIDEADDCPPT